MVPQAADEPTWHFWLTDKGKATAKLGLAQDDDGLRWEIRDARGLVLNKPDPADPPLIMANRLAGLVLHDGTRAIAAVDMVLGGHVWIADDLPAHHKLAAASIATALLLRDQFVHRD